MQFRQNLRCRVLWLGRSVMECPSTCSKVIDEKYRQSVCAAVCYFAVNIPLVFHNCIHFRSRSRPVFYGSGSDSGSEQTVSAAPAPAPAPTKMCRLRRLRLRLRLRLRIPAYKPIDGNLKTAAVAVLKSTEHDVTLTLFVADLSYPGISKKIT